MTIHEKYERYKLWHNRNRNTAPSQIPQDESTLVSWIKGEIQYFALHQWAINNFKGVVVMGTGTGKTRIGVIGAAEFIRRSNNTERSLITVPTVNLQENEWPNEFKKWGYETELERVDILTNNAARELKGEHYNTLVVDEAHTLLSPANIKLLKNNTFDRILMLTATFTNSKIKFLQQNTDLKVLFKYNIEQAEKDGIVSENTKFKLYVDLTESERMKYESCCSRMNQAAASLGGNQVAFMKAKRVLSGRSKNKHLIGPAKKYMAAVRERKDIVNNAVEKYKVIKQLQEEFIKEENTIIFSESIDFVKDVQNILGDASVAYHSKLTKKQKQEALETYISGKVNILVSAKALNAGLDIPKTTYGIVLSGNSSSLDKTQREGRVFRAEEGKHAVFINVCCRDTVEEHWVKNSYSKRKIKPITVNSIDELKQKLHEEIAN